MKLNEFKERAPRGTYYGAHPTKETKEAMREFLKDNKIPNPLDTEKMHCTIVFSRVFCGEKALGDLDPHWKGKFDGYDLFGSSPVKDEDTSSCLILAFACPEMMERHKSLKSLGATHDFPELKPHVTLSYDVGPEYDHLALPNYDGPIHFHHEYNEPLNLSWVKTKAKSS